MPDLRGEAAEELAHPPPEMRCAFFVSHVLPLHGG